MPKMMATTTLANSSDMFTSVVRSFGSHDPIIYFIHVSSHEVVSDLEASTSTFWAFLLSHGAKVDIFFRTAKTFRHFFAHLRTKRHYKLEQADGVRSSLVGVAGCWCARAKP